MTYLPHKTPGPPWPPLVGEALPRATEAYGVREKLAGYSLDIDHADGAPKARGFERILNITIEDAGYLEGAIQTGILLVPIGAVQGNPPWGLKCVIDVPIRGLNAKSNRVVNVRTVWEIASSNALPRLVNAYPKP